MMWGAKGIRSPPFSILHAFHKYKVLLALQYAQTIFILKCAAAINEVSYGLGILSRSLPISLFDMFFTTGRGYGTLCSPCGLPF
jgi:hypothetical protein